MASEDSRHYSEVVEPFLLVLRTSHIVTALKRERVVEDPSALPANSRLRTAPSPVRGAAPLACLGLPTLGPL
jgi:hypothetical protein